MNGKSQVNSSIDGEFSVKAWQILHEGTSQMMVNVRNKDAFLAAYDRMDFALADLVSEFEPSDFAKAEIHNRLIERLDRIGAVMRRSGINAEDIWKEEKRAVGLAIIRSIKWKSDVIDISDAFNTAVTIVAKKSNLTVEVAERLLREFAVNECKSIGDMLQHIGEKPSHIDFLHFLKNEGRSATRAAANQALSLLEPTDRKAMAITNQGRRGVVLDFHPVKRLQ